MKRSWSRSSDNYEELIYEGYAPGGVAVVIEAMTDNRNRTAGDIRSFFTKYNGSLGATGCVGWMFDQRGVITFNEDTDFDKLFEAAISLDALDVTEEDGQYKVITSPENFQNVVEGLENAGFKSWISRFNKNPSKYNWNTDEKTADQILKLLDQVRRTRRCSKCLC